jgi:glycosyltransferase involved in cell wall biosynthesis
MSRRTPGRVEPPTVLQLVPRLDPDELGGATVDVARALRAAGWRALVASAGGPLERELHAAGARMVRLPLDEDGLLRHWQNSRQIVKLVREEGVSLIHARSPELAAIAADLARRVSRLLVVTAHVMPDADGRHDAPYRLALRAADRVIAVSEFAAEHLVNGLALEPERVRAVPRWVDTDELDPYRVRGHRVAAAAERCGLGVGPRVIGVPLEVAATDGTDLLLRSVARLDLPDAALLFLGSLPQGREAVARLTAALRSAGLTDRARFASGVTDVAALLALVDVLLVPAVRPRAAMPLAAAAQAMGKPVIVTATGALPELVMPAVTGWLLPADDPGEIAWALNLALKMGDDVRDRVARRAREFALTAFAAPAVLEQQLELYGDLLRPAGVPSQLLASRAEAG